MGTGLSKITSPAAPPPPPPPPRPRANDVVAALVEAGPVLARLATAVLTSPRFVLLITLLVIGMAARYEGCFSSSTYILAIFSAVMGLHAATPAPTEADDSWLGLDPMSPAALGLVAFALAALPLYRDGRVTLRCVGFVATFLLVQSGIEAAQLVADKAAWLLEVAGGWGAFSLAFRAVVALLASRQVIAALPVPKPPATPAAASSRKSARRGSSGDAPGSRAGSPTKSPKPSVSSLLRRASLAVSAVPTALLEVGRLAKTAAGLKLGVRRFNQAASSMGRKSVVSTAFKGLTRQLTQPFATLEKQGSGGMSLKRLRSLSSVISVTERQEMALKTVQVHTTTCTATPPDLAHHHVKHDSAPFRHHAPARLSSLPFSLLPSYESGRTVCRPFTASVSCSSRRDASRPLSPPAGLSSASPRWNGAVGAARRPSCACARRRRPRRRSARATRIRTPRTSWRAGSCTTAVRAYRRSSSR